MSDPKSELSYPVLTPFKFRGGIVKPPAILQLAPDQAREYQAAGVLGGGDPPAGGTGEPPASPPVRPVPARKPAPARKKAAT